jgi:hypothetical protein
MWRTNDKATVYKGACLHNMLNDCEPDQRSVFFVVPILLWFRRRERPSIWLLFTPC